MTNTVLIKRSGTANSIPSAGNLQPGELAINYVDGNLFYKNNSNIVTVIASDKFVSVTGNIQGANLNAIGLCLSGNVLSAINLTSNITTTANISGSYFIGNGSQLTGIGASSYGNAEVAANLAAFANNPISTTGNITGGNIITSGVTSVGSVSAMYLAEPTSMQPHTQVPQYQ